MRALLDPAVMLNPEAGHHPMTTDPAEIEAVGRANERSFAEFPYYDARFGERGFRFGLSDGAWLVTLCDATPARALEQVRWLGVVLSSRGMPQILLERHLEFLNEELGRSRRYAILGRCARELRRLRFSVIPQKRFDELVAGFDEAAARSAPFPRMGALLVSAVADEQLGIERAVISLESWAADRRRFPRRWVEAVAATIDRARKSRLQHR